MVSTQGGDREVLRGGVRHKLEVATGTFPEFVLALFHPELSFASNGTSYYCIKLVVTKMLLLIQVCIVSKDIQKCTGEAGDNRNKFPLLQSFCTSLILNCIFRWRLPSSNFFSMGR